MIDLLEKEKRSPGECRFSALPEKWRSLLLQGRAHQIGKVVPIESGYVALFIWSIAVAVVFFVVAKNSALGVIQWLFSKNVWQHLLIFLAAKGWPADLFVGSLIFMLAMGSWIVPHFVSGSSGGFADAASAVLRLLLMLGLALVFSLYLLTVTMRNHHYLGLSARIAGIAPSAVLAASQLATFNEFDTECFAALF